MTQQELIIRIQNLDLQRQVLREALLRLQAEEQHQPKKKLVKK